MKYIAWFLSFLFCSYGWGQVSYTANDLVAPYHGSFRPGINLGNYPGWTDEQLATLAAGDVQKGFPGVGAKTLRPALFESFLEAYGYDSRLDAFRYFDSLGLKDHTVIIGFPGEQHRDPARYCPTEQSTLFANLYEPIWDNGADGTPVNDSNYYALYLYKMVSRYKPYVRFWEIWNEPGFDYTRNRGWLPPGAPGNWWENNPDPCDYKLRAPIFHYVRLLRISYEVIKFVDPNAFVVLSGTGYPSFLDAVLRNTDNPDKGQPSAAYPLGGGAYFDVMGYHAYPHFDGSLRYWDDQKGDFVHTRHSDAAMDGFVAHQDIFQSVLSNYGYDGQTFPLKHWMVTESNVPRKPFADFIGSDEAQRNFMLKSVIGCLERNMLQLHIYKLAEEVPEAAATYEFEAMGMYPKLNAVNLYLNQPHSSGIAYSTVSNLLEGYRYDPTKSAQLQLPQNARVAAFVNDFGRYAYTVWARTSEDNSETASSIWKLPDWLKQSQPMLRLWDYAQTREERRLDSDTLLLNSTPLFLTESLIRADQYSGCAPWSSRWEAPDLEGADSWHWQATGAEPATGSGPVFQPQFPHAGRFELSLVILNTAGDTIAAEQIPLQVDAQPQAAFTLELDGHVAFIKNESSPNSRQFNWTFGDGTRDTAVHPIKIFSSSGHFPVKLTAQNACGDHVFETSIRVDSLEKSRLSFTANDTVPHYNKPFRLGANLDYFEGWSDDELSDLAAGNPDKNIGGAGARAVRDQLPHYFLEGWGYDIRKPAWQYRQNSRLEENIAVLGFPAFAQQETEQFCPGQASHLFDKLYLDIWDDGADGTPVNEANPYAAYVYQTVLRYRDYVRWWEILNGPGFDITGEKGWQPAGARGNWWDGNPDPCDYELRAPVFHYIRILRISYEIIKTLDPDAYVLAAELGYPSFLDAVLRNTDNPEDGAVAPGFPYTGGAYFDAVGMVAFPHLDGSTFYFDLAAGRMAYRRHSDAAAGGIVTTLEEWNAVLEQYGYNGQTYPRKNWIVTKCNLPRLSFGNQAGSGILQRNYLLKAYIKAVQAGISQLHVQQIAERTHPLGAVGADDVMGLYAALKGIPSGSQEILPSGIALRTATALLYGADYDQVRTAALQLPPNIDGAAFRYADGNWTYVLWAKTTEDQSEEASAQYVVPAGLRTGKWFRREWDYGATGLTDTLRSDTFLLSATPAFFSEKLQWLQLPQAKIEGSRATICPGETVRLQHRSLYADSLRWVFPGGFPETASSAEPVVQYDQPGRYPVMLEVFNAAGQHQAVWEDWITVRPEPKAAFEAVVDGAFLRINNQSVDADWYHWDFGDGTSSLAYHPEHFYFGNGAFTVTLIAGNTCGADTLHRAFSIGAAPKAGWDFLPHSNCSPLLIHFLDASYSSPDEWQWFFENGIPAQSKERNPSVQFESPGRYEVLQIVSNSYGADTLRRFIEVQTVLTHLISDTLCHDAVVQIEGRVFDKNHPSATWSFKTAQGCDSLVKVDLVFADSLRLDRFLVDRQSHSITLSVSGGIAPYAYRWPDGREGAVITDLPAGVYRVSVTDQLGCETAFDITVDYTTGTGIVASTEEVYWSPNPAAGGQIMRWKGPAIRRLRCYDVQGNLHAAVEAGAVFKAPLVAGMYLVAAEMLDGTWIWRKLLVQ